MKDRCGRSVLPLGCPSPTSIQTMNACCPRTQPAMGFLLFPTSGHACKTHPASLCMNECMSENVCMAHKKTFHTKSACSQRHMHTVHNKMDLTHAHFMLHHCFLPQSSKKRIHHDTHIHTREIDKNDLWAEWRSKELLLVYYYVTWNHYLRPSYVPERRLCWH